MEPRDFAKGQRHLGFLVVVVMQCRVQGLIDQTAFAASTNATHTSERAEWDFDRYIFQVVPIGTCKSNAFAVSFPALFGNFNLAFTVKV